MGDKSHVLSITSGRPYQLLVAHIMSLAAVDLESAYSKISLGISLKEEGRLDAYIKEAIAEKCLTLPDKQEQKEIRQKGSVKIKSINLKIYERQAISFWAYGNPYRTWLGEILNMSHVPRDFMRKRDYCAEHMAEYRKVHRTLNARLEQIKM